MILAAGDSGLDTGVGRAVDLDRQSLSCTGSGRLSESTHSPH